MTDPTLLWTSAGLAAVGFAALVSALILVRRRGGWTPSEAVDSPPAVPCAGPLARLDFARSLDPILFAEAAEEAALTHARVHLRDLMVDGTTISLQSLRQLAAHSEMVVTASSKATKALRAGTAVYQRSGASGRFLPHVMDRGSGRAIEWMNEVGGVRKAVQGAAAVSTIVVSAAHMIAAADLARLLGRVDQKLDLLIAYRQIDQNAALERIYTDARELLASPLDEMRRMEVWRLRGDLRALRSTWRRELEHHLTQIENPAQEAWFDRMFTSQSNYDKRITGKISGGLLQLMMVEYSLRLDRVLAAATETWELSEITLADELTAIARTGTLLKEKAAFISADRRVAVQPMIEGIEAIVLNYRGLLGADPNFLNSPVADATPMPLVQGV